MNYKQLKEAIVSWTHRSDLNGDISTFVANTTVRLNDRFGVSLGPLIADDDTNVLLEEHAVLYLYGSLREQAIWSHNLVASQAYEALYQQAVSDMNINVTDEDWYVGPPAMEPYIEEVA